MANRPNPDAVIPAKAGIQLFLDVRQRLDSRFRGNDNRRGLTSQTLFLILSFALVSACYADTVIMKDGTVYKGKIQIDTDKQILIGNPPYDPTSYLLQAQDIEKIVYEEYHPEPPAVRKRGLLVETSLSGNVFPSGDLSVQPTAGLYGGLGFRLHPFFEIDGGVNWLPGLQSRNTFALTDDHQNVLREYKSYHQWNGEISGRFYPFYRNPWKTEPFFTAGYSWDHLTPASSGDSFRGSAWLIGFGAIHPLTQHLFLDGRFLYRDAHFGDITFLGQDGSISPAVKLQDFSISAGLSYRL